MPTPTPPLRLPELVGPLALAQDTALGQPLESQLRSSLLAAWMCEAGAFGREVRDTAYWVSLLRYIGCTGHAHEVATVFGDEIAIRAQTLIHDAANTAEVMGDVTAFATRGRAPEERQGIIQMIQQTAVAWAEHNFASGCEVADMLVARLDFGPAVRTALRYTFERWNGHGFPAHVGGETIPLPMRVVHLSHDMEAIARIFSPEKALQAARDRREPHRMIENEALDEALAVAADFIDLKSPRMSGHSRRCAQLAGDAAQVLGLDAETVTGLRRAALLHDFGTTGVSHSILEKPASLTRAEFDRVELHPMLTEQMLRRSPALAALNPYAAAHHEKSDGSGYHKRVRADAVDPGACVLAAVEIYVGMTTDRADRDAWSAEDAAAELRQLASRGVTEPRATRAVLEAAGHAEPRARTVTRAQLPGRLSRREMDVLRLAARGLTTQQIADRLSISPKTADHHVQHIYTKIGVSTRAAAALWATQHAMVA